MTATPLFVGLDVHKDSIAAAHAQGQSAEPPVFLGTVGTGQADLDKLIRRLQARAAALVFAYEAGRVAITRTATSPTKAFPAVVVAAQHVDKRPLQRAEETAFSGGFIVLALAFVRTIPNKAVTEERLRPNELPRRLL